MDPAQVVGIIAGGPVVLTTAVEDAKDHEAAAVRDLNALGLTADDVVVGIRTSGAGRPPIVVPTVNVLVAESLSLGVLMSVTSLVSVTIGTAATWLLANGGAVAKFIFGGLFLPLVMIGTHQGLIPIRATLIEQTGWTVLLPVPAMGGAG